MDRVRYPGYIVDRHGVHVDPTKIQVICDWKTPTTVTELRNFLGLGNFYVNVYAIIIVLCISIDKSIIRTRSLRNTHSQETQHLSWETL
jgi:hypothetical protein